MSVESESEVLRLELRLAQIEAQSRAKRNFIDFAKYVWPEAILGNHHQKMASAFDRIANGTLKRLIVNMAPRHTKSEFSSYLLPAFIMGRGPRTKIIQATHTGELAVRFGRKVRNLMDSDSYKQLFPGSELKADSKAAGRWDTSEGGEYFAVGVGGAMTGRGADLLIIDDPHSEQDAMSALALDNAWEWYSSGPRQRLQPGGAIVIVMCMTGDTLVLMSDGTQTPLSEIRPGDKVATFEKGRLATARVNNWKSNGYDSIAKIQTQSGRILRANARHPFLVMNAGVLEWKRVSQLRVGDELVVLKGAIGLPDQKQNSANVDPAKQVLVTTEKTQTLHTTPLATTANGKERPADAVNPCSARGSVLNATETTIPVQREHPSKAAPCVSSTGMESLLDNMSGWFKSVKTVVMSAVKRLQIETLGRIGTASFVLTTTTTREQCEDSCAMTATSPSDMARRQRYSNELQSISDFTIDPIASILPDGKEEVFDVEIDRTGNFIANGVVSHNTRWGTKDLTARLIKSQSSHNADRWEVIEFPAILPSDKPLWPEFWKYEELMGVKASLSPQKWQAQWQQQPSNDEGAILKREWWKRWEKDYTPNLEYVIQSYDTAYSKKETADFSAITTWGVFYPDQDSGAHILLLNVKKGRWDFPELKRVAKEEYIYWQPDNVLIEAKATGTTLQQELRKMGIPVTMYSPGGRRAGQDKVSRANAIATILESGMVWAPDTDWADELIEECAAFPNGDNDDLVDSMVMALMRFRAGNFISLLVDEDDVPRNEGIVPEYY